MSARIRLASCAAPKSLRVEYAALAGSVTANRKGQAFVELQRAAKLPNVFVDLQDTRNSKPARFLNLEDSEEAINRVLRTAGSAGVKEITGWQQGIRLSDSGLPPETVDFLRKGDVTHDTMCFACHGYNGQGQTLEESKPGKSAIMAPSFVSSDTVQGDPTRSLPSRHTVLKAIRAKVRLTPMSWSP